MQVNIQYLIYLPAKAVINSTELQKILTENAHIKSELAACQSESHRKTVEVCRTVYWLKCVCVYR